MLHPSLRRDLTPLGLTFVLFFAVGSTMHGKDAPSPRELGKFLEPMIANHKGVVAVAVKHLPTGESFQHNADRPMPTASLIKFPVLVTAFYEAAQGSLDWEELIELQETDKVPGSGVLTEHFSSGARVSVRDAARLMIAFSDNTATNLVVDKIGIITTAQRMETLGLENTKLHAKVYRRDTSVFPERSKQFGLGSTTANEMVKLFELLWKNELVSPAACDEIKNHLYACDDRGKLARYLPPTVKFAHKTGAVSQTRCDAGIIVGPKGPTVVCVLTTQNEDQRWSDENAAHKLCAEIGRAVFSHFHNADGALESSSALLLANGAMGPLVRALQRTLNKRLTPSPELSLDGDFGPATERALIQFQKTRQDITATGVVDAATWKALGPLETEDDPVPAPERINSEILSRAPQDPVVGKPFVTCKAWAVMNAKTGDFLGEDQSDRPLDMASTTKIMTAYVALDCCQRLPNLLDESLVFSRRADDTVGSTSGLVAGERIIIRELLYGLLLPSGNDASVAIAEFFGRHVEFEAEHDDATGLSAAESYDRFIAAMNDSAKELGMNASFKNPHGLTAPGHLASAKSLAILARAAMQYPLFREIVNTRQRGYRLESQSGYTRNIVWKNTNRLLGIAGYSGVKTGTTNAAGACLVSYCQREDDALITVVLGSSSSDTRYADTRNLFRWAWNSLIENEATSASD